MTFQTDAPDQPRITATATKPVTGTAVTLTCSARATPAAQFRFLSGNGSVLQDGANANFVISPLNYVEFTNYSATYGCIAYNSYGEAPRQEIVLDIQGSYFLFRHILHLHRSPSYLNCRRARSSNPDLCYLF